jgi:hypothetical protein
MGTGYKGGSKYYRSIGQNILLMLSKYAYNNGRFGVNSPSTGNKTRNISSDDPAATAKDFYDKIALGGIEKTYNNGALKITYMADGTIISTRKVSRSDGTPVVEINISRSTHTGGLKEQKIHFIKE